MTSKRPKTQDDRSLRRYKRRWKSVRLVAWPGNFRRQSARFARRAFHCLGLFHLNCILTLLRYVCSQLQVSDPGVYDAGLPR